jgi:hypothetical protein
MPKLNGVQIAGRLHRGLEEPHCGNEIAIRDLKILLTEDQIVAMEG